MGDLLDVELVFDDRDDHPFLEVTACDSSGLHHEYIVRILWK